MKPNNLSDKTTLQGAASKPLRTRGRDYFQIVDASSHKTHPDSWLSKHYNSLTPYQQQLWDAANNGGI